MPNEEEKSYFLKPTSLDDIGRQMMEGEFESLRAMYTVSPELVPYVHAWGRFKNQSLSGSDVHFLLADYHEISTQPPDPITFTARLSELHKNSVSPTGKFGFHTKTYHATVPQVTDCWEDSWAVLYRKKLSQMIKLDHERHGHRTGFLEFTRICHLILDKVIPRLLLPLQSEGRSIKPCLVHGDLWDENTATDANTGEPLVFDACSFYAHNEYEIGNWRAARHRLSDEVYLRSYKRNFPPSEPVDEWDDRNLLYSLRYDFSTAIMFPESSQHQTVLDNMTLLCNKFCHKDLVEL